MNEETKHAGGRPTDYGPEIIEKSLDYIANYNTKYDDKIPTVSGLAIELGFARKTLYSWAKDEEKQEFSNILDVLMAKQERVLGNHGLDGTFNSTITKMFMTKHGYHDKQDTMLTDGEGKPLNTHFTITTVSANKEKEE